MHGFMWRRSPMSIAAGNANRHRSLLQGNQQIHPLALVEFCKHCRSFLYGPYWDRVNAREF